MAHSIFTVVLERVLWNLASNILHLGRADFDYSYLGMGNISILSYIVILRAHDNRIVVVLQLSSYRLHMISGAFA